MSVIPKFQNQPNENSEFSPAVCAYLKSKNHEVVLVDGVFDLLVLGNNQARDKFIELKVCLSSQRQAVQISAKQWKFLGEVGSHSSLDQAMRYFIYDHALEKYAICKPLYLKERRQESTPTSTSYLQRASLSSLVWLEPDEAFEELHAWLAVDN